MPLREKHYIKRPDKYFHQVYNAGKAYFGEVITERNEYGEPTGNRVFEEHLVRWYRKLGVTAEDMYYAKADAKEMKGKIAIKGDVEVDTKWHLKMGDRTYAVYRVYFDARKEETEINYVEV